MTRPFLSPAQYKARADVLAGAIDGLRNTSKQYPAGSDLRKAFQWVAGCLATQHRWLLKTHPVAQSLHASTTQGLAPPDSPRT
jgi:hypothetical protein